MKRTIKRLVLISAIAFPVYSALSTETSTRAIFMSTAGSVIEKTEQKGNEESKKAATAKKITNSNSSLKQKIPAGLSIQVLKVEENNSLTPVNPSKYTFKSGDRFIVKFETNLPGYVEIYNITPDKRINNLGTYEVPGFSAAKFPKEGEFQLVNKKGIETLEFVFHPCNPEKSDTQKVASRDITVVSNENTSAVVNSSYAQALPSCSIKDEGIEYKQNNGKVAMITSRDIIATNSSNYSNVKFEDNTIYSIKKISNNSVKPIIAVLKIKHM
ncbi:MAG: hypothetical protein ABWJ98_01020 [Hydrogenothermaceae bacterium]